MNFVYFLNLIKRRDEHGSNMFVAFTGLYNFTIDVNVTFHLVVRYKLYNFIIYKLAHDMSLRTTYIQLYLSAIHFINDTIRICAQA